MSTDPMAAAVKALPWHAVHFNLVTLTAWMAGEGFTAGQVADAVEKPWKHWREFRAAEQCLTATDLDEDERECCVGTDVCGECTSPGDYEASDE